MFAGVLTDLRVQTPQIPARIPDFPTLPPSRPRRILTKVVIPRSNTPMKDFRVLPCLWVLALLGCQGPQYTSFAPVTAELLPIPGGGAKYFVMLNTSGRTLHNFNASAYLWDERSESPISRQRPFKRYFGSGPACPSRQIASFRGWAKHTNPIIEPATHMHSILR